MFYLRGWRQRQNSKHSGCEGEASLLGASGCSCEILRNTDPKTVLLKCMNTQYQSNTSACSLMHAQNTHPRIPTWIHLLTHTHAVAPPHLHFWPHCDLQTPTPHPHMLCSFFFSPHDLLFIIVLFQSNHKLFFFSVCNPTTGNRNTLSSHTQSHQTYTQLPN